MEGMTGITMCRGKGEIIAPMHKWYIAPLHSMLLQCVVFAIGFGDNISLKYSVGWFVVSFTWATCPIKEMRREKLWGLNVHSTEKMVCSVTFICRAHP